MMNTFQKTFLSCAVFAISLGAAQLSFADNAQKPRLLDIGSYASPAQQKAQLAKLTDYIDGVQTMSGDFQQTVYSNRGQEISSGAFKLKKPGRFAWYFNPPNEQQIISNGQSVYQYDVGLEQVVIRPRNEIIGGNAMNMLVGSKKLSQLFDIKQPGYGRVPTLLVQQLPGEAYYQLSSKKKQNDAEQIWLVANQQGELKALYLDSGTGQKTVIKFSHVKRNTPIADSTFDFKPPKGVDVIGG